MTDNNGCTDDVTRIIVIDDLFNIFVPNAFTPNQDGFNDVFLVEGTDIDPNRYEMLIFDRWGEVVWESHDPTDVWTGSFQNGDHYVVDDTYMWRMVVYSKTRPERHEILGYVTVVR
ncbi:MAG: T9SS type B sorting domain-containing protein [Flavobacteriales bacterium]|nr:T9SS type B sorting domain-containing protein [Flavobacteriales bacterium]